MPSIHPIPAFKDNYIWILVNEKTQQALVVDPGDATPVLNALKSNNLSLTHIFVTHHHHDHSGGILELVEKTGAIVYGTKDSLHKKTNSVREGENIFIESLDLHFSVLEIPGHTLDHVAFICNPNMTSNDQIDIEGARNKNSDAGSRKNFNNPILFCGDTLFTAGCGRVFEGTHEQMLASLKKLKALPKNTLVYCGHEYTEANLKFAHFLEPENENVSQRIKSVSELRSAGKPSVPASMEEELKTNPFLRTADPLLVQAASQHAEKKLKNEVEVFTFIRNLKDKF